MHTRVHVSTWVLVLEGRWLNGKALGLAPKGPVSQAPVAGPTPVLSNASLRRKGGPPTTPAMAAGITDWRMRMEDVVTMIDEEYERTRPKTRGPYRKRAA